ncbi:MAG: hypothetical protein ACOYOP_14295 [Microthrixaceae bacterium]
MTGSAARVVVLDPDAAVGAAVAGLLRAQGWEAAATDDPGVAGRSVTSEGVRSIVVSCTDTAALHGLRAVHPSVPVVALVDDPDGADAALAAGADSALLRPVDVELIDETLHRLLGTD